MTTPGPGVWPCLTYVDADAAIRFLTDVLGFRQAARYDDGGLVVHAELRWPEGGGVMLGSAREGGPQLPPGVGVVYVVTQDPDGVHARASAAGAQVSDLVERDYGSRECTVTDPGGVVWSFGTYAGE
jgi:uncharacterized glyoxalase superfamily protein PhnB